MVIDSGAFAEIIEELTRRPLQVNRSRKGAGRGCSQAFGIVNKRSKPPDYSALCRDRPYMYRLLLDFARVHVPHELKWNAITVNQCYQCLPHKDKGNLGSSFLVAFGEYTGGDLVVQHEGGGSERHNINCRPIIMDFSKHTHWVEEFQGARYSLVFYFSKSGGGVELPAPSVRISNNRHVFFRGDSPVTYDKYRSSTRYKNREREREIRMSDPPARLI